MKKIIPTLFLLMAMTLVAVPVYAQDPTPTPAVAGLDTAPYDYENGASAQLPPMDFVSVGILNTFIKSARTVLEMVKALKLYLYAFLLVLAFWVLKWIKVYRTTFRVKRRQAPAPKKKERLVIMRLLILFLSVAILFAAVPAHAQGPTPTPGGSGGAIPVNRDPLPYQFEAYDFDTSNTPMSDNLNLGVNFYNPVGGTALTMFKLFDGWGVLGIFVVLFLAVNMLWRIYSFTMSSGTTASNMKFPDETPDDPTEYVMERYYNSNPYKVYRTILRERGKFR